MAGRGTDIKLSDSKAAGGLTIIGTEQHESRRVDRQQLRGRSGRQGDPGSSLYFFISMEDLMRLFGSDRMARWLSIWALPTMTCWKVSN